MQCKIVEGLPRIYSSKILHVSLQQNNLLPYTLPISAELVRRSDCIGLRLYEIFISEMALCT